MTVGHIPTGASDILMAQANYASQIYHRYRDTIAAHFYGHTHSDTFAIAYSDYSNRSAANAEGIAYVCGALTPMSGNPVFRVYDVHSESYEVMDFRVYRGERLSRTVTSNGAYQQPLQRTTTIRGTRSSRTGRIPTIRLATVTARTSIRLGPRKRA